MIFPLIFVSLFVVGVLGDADSYDAAKEMEIRRNTLERVCHKYKDPSRLEYAALYNSTITEFPDAHRYYRLRDVKLLMCAPAKTGTNSWRNTFGELMFQKRKELEAIGEKLELDTLETPMEALREYTRAITVRHPLERILSAYRYMFLDSTIHRDLTHKLKEFWLNKRQSLRRPGEDPMDDGHKPTITFREFVVALNKCPAEYPDCANLLDADVGMHWRPFWKVCVPCAYPPKYIVDLNHVEADKTFLFQEMGLNASVPMKHTNPTKKGHSSNKEDLKEYYSQLYKSEVRDLYLRYKLDHELFGFSPDSFIDVAQEDVM